MHPKDGPAGLHRRDHPPREANAVTAAAGQKTSGLLRIGEQTRDTNTNANTISEVTYSSHPHSGRPEIRSGSAAEIDDPARSGQTERPRKPAL